MAPLLQLTNNLGLEVQVLISTWTAIQLMENPNFKNSSCQLLKSLGVSVTPITTWPIIQHNLLQSYVLHLQFHDISTFSFFTFFFVSLVWNLHNITMQLDDGLFPKKKIAFKKKRKCSFFGSKLYNIHHGYSPYMGNP